MMYLQDTPQKAAFLMPQKGLKMVYYITATAEGRDRLSTALDTDRVIAANDNGTSNADIIEELRSKNRTDIFVYLWDCITGGAIEDPQQINIYIRLLFPFEDCPEEETTLISAFEIYGESAVVKTIRNAVIKERTERRERESRRPHSIQEVLNTQLKPPRHIVDNLITQGLNLVVGVPKVGKSFFCLQMAINIATGTQFLGRKTEKTAIIYYALEDKDAGVTNSRLRLQQGAEGLKTALKTAEKIDFIYRADDIKSGFLAELDARLDMYDSAVVIIDTLSRVKGITRAGANAFEQDYDAISKLVTVADMHGAALIVVHHANKRKIDRKQEDIFDKINGSQGLRAAADNIIFVDREPNKREVTISAEGRFIEKRAFLAATDDCMRWSVICDNAEEYQRAEGYKNNGIVLVLKELFNRYGERGKVQYKEVKQLQEEMLKSGQLARRAFIDTREITEALTAGLADEIEENEHIEIETRLVKKNKSAERGLAFARQWWTQGELTDEKL